MSEVQLGRGIGARFSDALVGVTDGVMKSLATLGDFVTFAIKVFREVPATVTMYPKETLRQIKDIAWGSGALLVGGGTVGVMILLSVAAGTSIGIEGFNGLEIVGLAPRFTAQIGSMKLHEEVDALEVMAVSAMRYVVTTRVIACMVAILPLYMIGLIGSYVASQASVVLLFGQSPGQYDHYFSTFIQGRDILFSVIKILIFALTVALIHSWYGMRVSGGPQAVGEATGTGIRASIVSIVVLDMVLTLLFWGGDPGFRISG